MVKKMPREISRANGVEDIVVQERRGASNIAAVRSFIRSHEVLTFFLLAYAIAWGALALIIPFISGSARARMDTEISKRKGWLDSN